MNEAPSAAKPPVGPLAQPWPIEIRLSKDKRFLTLDFDDGKSYELSAEMLRVLSPSAEVRGHSEAERKTVGGKRNVCIIGVDAMGNYAVRLTFDDLHATGIYTFGFLHELGVDHAKIWQAYLDELSKKGLDRDHPAMK